MKKSGQLGSVVEDKQSDLTQRQPLLSIHSVSTNSSSSVDEAIREEKEEKQVASQSSAKRIVILGINNGLIAVYMIGNGIIMSSLGSHEAAAGTLIGGIQGVIVGTIFGFLSSTGTNLGTAIGTAAAQKLTPDEKNALQQKLGDIIKTSWVLGAGMTVLGTACFVATPFILPHIVASPDTGKAAGKYFLGVAIGSFAESIGSSNRMILVQVEKAIWTAVFLTALQRLPPLALSYWWLAPKYGAFGVGIATSIPNIIALLANQALFSRAPYEGMQLSNCNIAEYKEHKSKLLSDGWKLALQRISEWGNLMGITLVIGAWKDSSLNAYQPAMHVNNFIGMVLQGAAQAAMNFVTEDCKEQREHYKVFKQSRDRRELAEFKTGIDLNKRTFIKNNLAGVGLAASFSAAAYFGRHYINRVFLGANIPPEQEDLAEGYLSLTILGLIPDALRIMSGGLLRGWDDLLYPTLVNFTMMTVVGVMAGAAIGAHEDKDVRYLLWSRIATIIISTMYNFHRFYTHVGADNKLYLDGEDWIEVALALEEWDDDSLITVIEDDEDEEKSASNFANKAQELGLHAIDGGDGLFAAVISTIAEYEANTKESLINLVADCLVSHKKDIYKNCEGFTDSIKSKTKFANDVILYGLAVALKINIVVIDSCNNISVVNTNTKDLPYRPTLCVGYDRQEKKYHALTGNPNINLLELPEARHITLKKISQAVSGRGYEYSSFLVAQRAKETSRNLSSNSGPTIPPVSSLRLP